MAQGIRISVYDAKAKQSISFSVFGKDLKKVAEELAHHAAFQWPGHTTRLNDRRHKRR